MGKIFRNLIPYWKSVLLIVLLLSVQAYCDLALPQYTSDMIDTGIQNSGISHIVPERITAKEFREAQIFMTDEEERLWNRLYDEDGAGYILNTDNEQTLENADQKLMIPVVLTYQTGHMREADFKETLQKAMRANPETAQMADQIGAMTMDEIETLLQTKISSFEAENEDGKKTTYVDMRPLMEQMTASGQISSDLIRESRVKMEKTLSAIGAETLRSMGIAYAAEADRAAGLDVDKLQTDYLWTEGFRMFLVAAFMLLAAVGISYLAARVGAGVGRDLRSRVFRNVVGFSSAEIDRFSTASLITRNTNDVQQIQMVTAMMLRMVLYAPIIGIGGVYKVAQTGAGMGYVIAASLLVILGFVLVLVSITMPKFKLMQTLVDNLNLVSREILTGLPVIRAFGREKTEEMRFDAANKALQKTQLFTNRVMSFMMPGMMLIMNCLVIVIMWVSSHRIDSGVLQVGNMTAFITYSMLIVMAFLMLTMMSIMLPRAGVAAERIEEVLKTTASITDPEHPQHLSEKDKDGRGGVLEFRNVSFRYPGASEDVLHDISFRAEPGTVTAIIGSTGAGKSTLVQLIPRFYDVTDGEITLDGVDLRSLPLKELRERIGFVPQKGILFSGTVASNLRFGNPDASDRALEEAAEIAQAAAFIEEKSEKYQSYIAQGGSNVSGGQKQRLAIARAVVKKPEIYVFDDSFSALDMKTDAKLRQALKPEIRNAAEIVVAQRISTILHADQILVLDDGKIAGKGTHEELLKTCEVYRQIARSQLSEKELGGGDCA